jgi:hypothetical protein
MEPMLHGLPNPRSGTSTGHETVRAATKPSDLPGICTVALYSFSVDVEVPPPVLAGRLGAVVAPMPTIGHRLTTSWPGALASDRPFLGTVDSTAFRLRRPISATAIHFSR